jgi:adenine phosphoribosyltransferase
MKAAYDLVKKFGIKKVYINFIIELEDLGGRKLFPEDVQVDALVKY